jgi:hypothetical protein
MKLHKPHSMVSKKYLCRDSHFSGLIRTVFYANLLLLLSLPTLGWAGQYKSEHQEMIHEMGDKIMPFDLSKTRHIFEMTETGGVQQVIVRDQKDSDQITLIRQHLQHEAKRFSQGDFSDPTSLHGTNMPGIKDLAAGILQIKITYSDLANGAQLKFETEDIHLITAIHRWFGAQLSDHGTDATYR